ncbi:MAG: hypothetical protein ACR2N9_09175 [Acidimicrobiia bacterium]
MDLRLDHLYRETHHWEASVAWWGTLGFTFAHQWGEEPHRAGALSNGSSTVVLAEVPADSQPTAATFLSTENLEESAHQLDTDIIDTHWGTRMVSGTDPDGRIYNIEPASEAP